jgi:hypothetical protein
MLSRSANPVIQEAHALLDRRPAKHQGMLQTARDIELRRHSYAIQGAIHVVGIPAADQDVEGPVIQERRWIIAAHQPEG